MNAPASSLPQLISPYIKRLIETTGGEHGPIGRQFIMNVHNIVKPTSSDDVIEGYNQVAPGMYYKYQGKLDAKGKVVHYGRVLWTITRFCATYCRFCTRGRLVGIPNVQEENLPDALAHRPYLTSNDIEQGIRFLQQHKEINEVILSGGDPLVVPQTYFEEIVGALVTLQKDRYIDIIRFHTRMPVTNPILMKEWHFNALKTIKNPWVVLHINHATEITKELEEIVSHMRACGAILLSQSVLLKGVNDTETDLANLFNNLVRIGIHPYYLHQNDNVSWAKEFTVPITKGKKLMRALRARLSGLAASAKYVLDAPDLPAKIPVEEINL